MAASLGAPDWLLQVMENSQLPHLLEEAATWVTDQGCVLEDLDVEIAAQFAEYLDLKPLQLRRSRNAIDTIGWG